MGQREFEKYAKQLRDEALRAAEQRMVDDECQRQAELDAKERAREAQRIRERKEDRRDEWLRTVFAACFGYVLCFAVDHFEEIRIVLREFFGKLHG